MRAPGRRILLAATLAAIGLAGPTLAAEPITTADLQVRLGEARTQASIGSAQPSTAQMDRVRAAIGLPLQVTTGAWTVDLPADPVLARLTGATTDDFERADARIELIEQTLEAALARDVPDAAAIDAALREAYLGIVEPRPSPWDELLRGIGEAIEAVVHRLTNALGGSAGAIVAIAVLAVAGIGVLFLVRRDRLLPDRTVKARQADRAARPADLAARAEEAIRAGDLREAVRVMYIALVASLAARGLLADAPALTAGEARSAVGRGQPALLPAVARATESYERVIYGGAAAEASDVEALRQAASLARSR